jgi:hypothetical protein
MAAPMFLRIKRSIATIEGVFIDTLMYGFSSTGVTIYCYFGLKFNDNTCCEVICKWRYNDNDIMITNKLPGMYSVYYNLYIYFLISYNPFFLMLEKQQKKKKGKKVDAVFFIK